MLRRLVAEYDKMFGEKTGGILQSYDELEQLVAEIGDRKFYNMAEIGSYRGGTVWLYCHLFAGIGCNFVIVDIKIQPIIYKIISAITERMDINFNILESPSHTARFGQVDFLHIDADHRYHMVRRDYEAHYNKVFENGVIILHDTLMYEGMGRNKSGVWKFRKELEASGANIKTFSGTQMLCDCFGPYRTNPKNRNIGTSIIYK